MVLVCREWSVYSVDYLTFIYTSRRALVNSVYCLVIDLHYELMSFIVVDKRSKGGV